MVHKILWPYMHNRLLDSFIMLLCDKLGHDIYLMDESWKNIIKYDGFYTMEDKGVPWILENPRVHIISHNEFMQSNKIDIVIANATENYGDILMHIWPQKRKQCKFITYFGNDFIPGISAIPFGAIKNHISADVHSYNEAIKRDVHSMILRPPIDFEIFKYTPITEYKKVKSYTHNFQYAWNQHYVMSKEIFKQLPLEWKNHGQNGDMPRINRAEDVAKEMIDSCLTNGLKPREGFGYTIIESMAIGRPVLLDRQMAKTRALYQWANERTALLCDSIPEGVQKIWHYLTDRRYAEELQLVASETVKKEINADIEVEKLKDFLKNLRN